MSEFSRSMTMGNVNERHQQPGNITATGDGRVVSQYDAPSFSFNHYSEASSSGNSHYMGAKQLGEKSESFSESVKAHGIPLSMDAARDASSTYSGARYLTPEEAKSSDKPHRIPLSMDEARDAKLNHSGVHVMTPEESKAAADKAHAELINKYPWLRNEMTSSENSREANTGRDCGREMF